MGHWQIACDKGFSVSRTKNHLVSSLRAFEAVDANFNHGKGVETAQHTRSISFKTLIQQTKILQTPLVSDGIHNANNLWRLPQARASRHVLPPPQHGDQQHRQFAPKLKIQVLYCYCNGSVQQQKHGEMWPSLSSPQTPGFQPHTPHTQCGETCWLWPTQGREYGCGGTPHSKWLTKT